MGRSVVVGLYVMAMVAVIVGADLALSGTASWNG